MKKQMTISLVVLAFAVISFSADVFAQQQREHSHPANQGTQEGQNILRQSQQGKGMGRDQTSQSEKDKRQSVGTELSDEERQYLILMREEEKLARDVYLAMQEKWSERVFSNIAQAESRHMSAMASLLSRYDVADPITDNTPGKFTQKRFQELYATLVEKGSKSKADAFKVGLKIEELDIVDLRAAIQSTNKQDIKRVFENLERGSRNHLRAFSAQLKAAGGTYVATDLNQQEFDKIANSPIERGGPGHRRGDGRGRGNRDGRRKHVWEQKHFAIESTQKIDETADTDSQEMNNQKHSETLHESLQAHGTTEWSVKTTIGKIVADRPETARIFELINIDYCCGGQKLLDEAAKANGIDPNQLLSALLVVGISGRQTAQTDWQQATLDELLEHIIATHHAWLRRELPPLLATTRTVHRVHGGVHKELAEIAETLQRINDAVLPHLDEEEKSVFPALRELASGNPPDSTAAHIESMKEDHDQLGKELHRLRELTDGFAIPQDACAKYREMLTGLAALEKDMLLHVHLENNIVVPKAQSMLSDICGN